MPGPAPLPALPKARRIRVVDGHLACAVAGAGAPSIVLLNGAGGPMAGWGRVFDPLAALGTVIAYDRFGVGRSDRPRRAQTGTVVVEALRELLGMLEVAPPSVLVGHSLGGLYANLFAGSHPGDVAGVVFIEAAHPDDRQLQGLRPAWMRGLAAVSSLTGRLRPRQSPAEVAHVDETVAMIAGAAPFPPIPIAVVTGSQVPPRWLMPDAARDLRRANQVALARLSPRSRHTISPRSGHFPQLSDPDSVVEAVRWVVDEVSAGRAAPG